jgi:DNA-binding transcriptional regulator PaaX
MPNFSEQFEMQLAIIEELREIINQKWTQEQQIAYITFLNDFTNYITNFVFTLQVHYY